MARAGALLRVVLLIISALLIAEGIYGPSFSPENFTAQFIWVHYRGLLVFSVLFFGNLFCAGCPLILFRNIGRKILRPTLRWPTLLRNKWLATGLFIGILFVYERYALWSSPAGTAALLLIYYFLIAVVDLLFKGASFCKFVCPVGQFNFLASMLSPFEVKAKDPSQCLRCKTFDCVKGNAAQAGCELKLFVPRKSGNLDCTFCMDCQRACPHGNVAVQFAVPGASVGEESAQPGIGRVWARADYSILIVVFSFGALLNLFSMLRPARELSLRIAMILGFENRSLALGVIFFIFLVVAPFALISLATIFGRWITNPQGLSAIHVTRRLIPVLIPLGFGIWSAHYLFHFLTGAFAFSPLLKRFSFFSHFEFLQRLPLGLVESAVLPIQFGFVVLGGSIAMAAAYSIGRSLDRKNALKIISPWIMIILFLVASALWLFILPMDMRGTISGG